MQRNVFSDAYSIVSYNPKHPQVDIAPLPLDTMRYLEHQLMRELALGKTPASLEVFRKVFGLLDRSKESRVNLLLVSSLGSGDGLLGFGLSILKELLLC